MLAAKVTLAKLCSTNGNLQLFFAVHLAPRLVALYHNRPKLSMKSSSLEIIDEISEHEDRILPMLSNACLQAIGQKFNSHDTSPNKSIIYKKIDIFTSTDKFMAYNEFINQPTTSYP